MYLCGIITLFSPVKTTPCVVVPPCKPKVTAGTCTVATRTYLYVFIHVYIDSPGPTKPVYLHPAPAPKPTAFAQRLLYHVHIHKLTLQPTFLGFQDFHSIL